jgi:hypothetical protein
MTAIDTGQCTRALESPQKALESSHVIHYHYFIIGKRYLLVIASAEEEDTQGSYQSYH